MTGQVTGRDRQEMSGRGRRHHTTASTVTQRPQAHAWPARMKMRVFTKPFHGSNTFILALLIPHARIMLYNGNFGGGLFSTPHLSICKSFFSRPDSPAIGVHFMQPGICLAC